MHNKISDTEIISMLQENNLKGWEMLYDKYAPLMYGLVYDLTNSKPLAEQIFSNAFLRLKNVLSISEKRFALCGTILRHTYIYTIKQLRIQGMEVKPFKPEPGFNIIQLLCTQCNSLKEIASRFHISEAEAKKQLLFELSTFRNK